MESTRLVELVSFTVTTYKNFIDSGEIEVDNEATVLVGKNEAGKSTLLDALWRLNPANEPDRDFDYVLDYPRWLKKSHEQDNGSTTVFPIEANFRLTQEGQDSIDARMYEGVIGASWSACRDYDGKIIVRLEVDFSAWLEGFRDEFGLLWSGDLPEVDLATFTSRLDSIEVSEDDPDLAALHEEAVSCLEGIDAEQVEADAREMLLATIPSFFFFDDVYLLPGSVSIDEIRHAVETGDETGMTETSIAAARFLRSVNLDAANLDPGNFEALQAELESVANLLTDRVQGYWHQNPHLEFKIQPENVEEPVQGGPRVVDRRLHFRVYDRRHRVTTPFSSRSTGFQWFVSFLAQFSYYAEGRADVIVLLDEPGVALHAKAQSDLLGFIDDELTPGQQVIYTTHSAWMVPVRKIHRVRTVEEDLAPEISTGATVSGKMLAKDRDTLMPLQAALGYDLAQTLFVGPDSLVVEGISEVLFLYDMSDLLIADGRTGLDIRWHICPAGSVGRIPAMLGLLGNSVDVTVVIDSPANPTEVGNIAERLYDNSRIIEIGSVTGTGHGDIEDLILEGDYLSAFNECFGTAIRSKDLKSQAPRITKRLEDHHGEYNHGEVARTWVRQRAANKQKVSDTTKSQFESLFDKIAATLNAEKAVPSATSDLLARQLKDGVITKAQYDEYTSE